MDVKKECKFCGSILSDQKRLEKHQKTSIRCISYQSMIIQCKHCNFETEYYSEFVKHQKICDKSGRVNKIQELEKYVKDLENKLKPKKSSKRSKSPVIDYNSLTLDEILIKISENICKIKDSKKYTKLLIEIKNLRIHLLKFYDFDQYIEYLTKNIEQITSEFKERKCDDKKIKSIIKSKILFPIESRMIYYEGFDTTNIDIEHIKFIKECNQFKMSKNTIETVYNIENVINYFTSYNICFIDIRDLIDTFVINTNNIVYLDLKKSTKEDPFSFYYLEAIKSDKKKWRMDCRLDEMISDLECKFKDHCINTFRKIYFKIFGDNEYRSNIFKLNEIFEYECKTIIKNLIFASDYMKLVKYFQKAVIKYHIYQKTDNDIFGLKSDCKITREQFVKYREKDYKVEVYKSISLLFDNIDNMHITEIYNDLFV